MAHGDAWEGKWRRNWQMERVANTLTLPRNVVYPALLTLMRTPRLPTVDWTDAPRRFKWTRPFRRKTKSGFCACAITFQTPSRCYECWYPARYAHATSFVANRLYNNIPYHLKGKIFGGEKITEYKMRVLIFSTTFVWNISHSRKN